MTSVKEAQCSIVSNNIRKQDNAKVNAKQFNSVKKSYRIIKRGISCDNILSAVANILSDTNTTEDFTDSILQDIFPITSDTLKDDFIHMGGNIGDLPDLKKQTVVLGIERRWGKGII